MTTLQKTCNLTDIETARFNQVLINPDGYPTYLTVKDLNVDRSKITKLVEFGYLRKAGFGFVDGSPVRIDFFKVA